jgi:GAF domain-containing protein
VPTSVERRLRRFAVTREAALARTLVELADTLVADFDVVELLTTLTDRCVEVLGVDASGIVLVSPDGDLRAMAASSDAIHVLDLLAVATQEGPSLDCYRTGQPIANHDLTVADARWPHFTPEALAAGFRSVHAVPMRLRGTVLGALNLLRRDPGDFDAADVGIAQAFADIATIAVLQHRAASDAVALNEQLSHALNSRIVIEQAKGMAAEHANTTPDAAFAAMRTYARNHNLRLVLVAETIINRTLSIEAVITQPGTQ